MKLLVTGGAGFIGSALIRYLLRDPSVEVVNVDKLTYAASPDALAEVESLATYRFEHVDVADARAVRRVFADHRPDGVIHLAAESHVDRSIDDAGAFVQTNVVGTHTLLDAARAYWAGLDATHRGRFRFHHVSTDEVYGELGPAGLFTEDSPYAPNSPYAASKAASDHLVRAWQRTYGLPTLVSNCSNNYGPYQFPEKLIPLMVLRAAAWQPLPVYGSGENVRDWLHVDDHARALWTIFCDGRPGETYMIGGESERRNLDVVRAICDLVDEVQPASDATARRSLITQVPDRPGHDARYAIDCTKLKRELGWRQRHSFESGLRETVKWYLTNPAWCERVRDQRYAGERLGLANTPEARP